MASRSRSLRSVLEWITLILFLAAPIGSSVLYGGVRLKWSGPFILATCAASLLLLTLKFLYREPLFRFPPAWLGLLAIGAYTFWSIPGSTVPYEAKLEFVKWAALLLTYWGLTELIAVGKRWKIVLALFLIAGSLITWYAIIQHSRGSNMVLSEPRPEGYLMRASGTLMCPNHFAYLLELYLVMGLALVSMRSAGAALRLIGGYAAVLTLPVLLLTESRSAWIGSVAGIGLLILLLAGRRSLFRLLISGVAFTLIVVLTAFALWTFSPTFKGRVKDAMGGNMRTQVWTDTLDMIQDEPVTGHGPGSYRWVYPRYKNVYNNARMFPRYAHNEYVHLQAEYGTAGTVIIGAALLFWLVRLLVYFRRTSSDQNAALLAGLLGAAAASGAHAMFDFNLHQFACQQTFALVAALVAASLFETQDRKALSLPAIPAGAMCAVGAVGCVTLAAAVGQMLLGYQLTDRAEAARKDLEPDAALVLADRAVRAYPDYWKAHRERALILKTQSFWNLADPEEKQQQAEAAVQAYQRALALNPCDIESMVDLSRLYGDLLGDQDHAIDTLQQTIDFAPNVFYIYSELGMRYRKVGRLEEALAAFQDARAIYRDDQMTNLNIERLKRMIRDQKKADGI